MEIIIHTKNDLNSFYKKIKYLKHSKKLINVRINKKLNITKKEKDELDSIIIALNIKDKNKRLSYIYDNACNIIDENYINKNYCEFQNNKCIIQRKYHNNNKTIFNGCCKNCEMCHKGCSIKSLGCKLYFCSELQKIKKCPTINDIKILKYFLSWKQKLFIKTAVFKSKDDSLKELKRKSLLVWSFSKL